MSMEQLKRALLKEELVALVTSENTSKECKCDFIDAIILNQFIYWSQRIKDFDNFILEEKQRAISVGKDIDISPSNGWIYKKCEELSEETLTGLAPANMRNRIKKLVTNGWLDERDNPYNKWDKVKQYRVNLIKIQKDLLKIGYYLQDYKIDMSLLVDPQKPTEPQPPSPEPKPTDESDNKDNGDILNDETKTRIFESKNRDNDSKNRITESEIRGNESEIRNDESKNRTSQIETAIPDITSDTTVDITITDNTYSENTFTENKSENYNSSTVSDYENEFSSVSLYNAGYNKNDRQNNNPDIEKCNDIINKCSLNFLDSIDREIAKDVIQELYFNTKFAKASLGMPIELVREKLERLNLRLIKYAFFKMRQAAASGTKIESTKFYLMTCVYNAISEFIMDTMANQGLAMEEIHKYDSDIFRMVRGTIYEKPMNAIKEKLTPVSFDVAFKGSLINIHKIGNMLFIVSNSEFNADLLKSRHNDLILECFKDLGIECVDYSWHFDPIQ